jgi:Uma2 family endonuclease
MEELIQDSKKYSFAEYLALEETSIERHDYYHGEIFAMAGGSKAHNKIILNIAISLKETKKSGCDIFIDGMKLELEKEAFYVYPDLMYTCDDNVEDQALFVKSPSIIFEVLSESTALYDREVKLKYYKKIKQLQYYVLVSQKDIFVEVYSRIEDSQIWQYQTYEDLQDIIVFKNIELQLPLVTIYESINFKND